MNLSDYNGLLSDIGLDNLEELTGLEGETLQSECLFALDKAEALINSKLENIDQSEYENNFLKHVHNELAFYFLYIKYYDNDLLPNHIILRREFALNILTQICENNKKRIYRGKYGKQGIC